MRILVAWEDEYRIYRKVIAAVILILRPHVEVETAELDALKEQIARFDPQVVICSQPNTIYPAGRATCIELSLHPNPLQPLSGATPCWRHYSRSSMKPSESSSK